MLHKVEQEALWGKLQVRGNAKDIFKAIIIRSRLSPLMNENQLNHV